MTERHPLRTLPVETDEQLIERMGTDPVLWASEFGKLQRMGFYDSSSAPAWFHHAIEAGRKAERAKLTASACDQCGVVFACLHECAKCGRGRGAEPRGSGQ